jgi:transposase-like protein
MRQANVDDGVKVDLTSSEQAEMVQVRKNMCRLDMENEILRFAAAYFPASRLPK